MTPIRAQSTHCSVYMLEVRLVEQLLGKRRQQEWLAPVRRFLLSMTAVCGRLYATCPDGGSLGTPIAIQIFRPVVIVRVNYTLYCDSMARLHNPRGPMSVD